MDIADVREVLHRKPFEPFLIRLADGRSLPVSDRDCVALTPGRVVVVAEDDSVSIIEPPMIVSLDSVPAKPKGRDGTNKGKRRES
jgi:hypothetical protein